MPPAATPPPTGGELVVLRFGTRRVPRALRALPSHDIADPADGAAIDTAVSAARRVAVLGDDIALSAVLTRLLRIDRLDVEVAHVPRLHSGRYVKHVGAQRVPLIRDERGQVLVGSAYWLPPGDEKTIEGEAIVDDTVLFDGRATAVRIEPLPEMPGLRAAVLSPRMRPIRWVTGRAAQLGTSGARVVRDGHQDTPDARPTRRSTFYRHTEGWLKVG